MTCNPLRPPADSGPPSGLSSPSSNLSASTLVSSTPRWADSRLRVHADYQRVYAIARKQFSSQMAWFAALRPAATTSPAASTPTGVSSRAPVSIPAAARIGLTVGKVLGPAHERNRIKRRLRVAIRAHLALLPDHLDLILHPRPSVLTAEFSALLGEVEAVFRQAADFARNHPHSLVKKPSAVPQPSSRRAASKGKKQTQAQSLTQAKKTKSATTPATIAASPAQPAPRSTGGIA